MKSLGKARRKSRLEVIRRKNARLEKRAPYNFCDRWCERCANTAQCMVYQEEFNSKLQHLANGKDPYDRGVVLEDVKKSFEKSLDLLKKFAEEKKIDLAAFDERQFKEQEKKAQRHSQGPLYKLAMNYSLAASRFLEDSLCETRESSPKVGDAFAVLRWYHTLIPVKAARVLRSLYVQDDEENGLGDAVAQLEIVKKAISSSDKAFRSVLLEDIGNHGRIVELLELLQRLRDEAEALETGI